MTNAERIAQWRNEFTIEASTHLTTQRVFPSVAEKMLDMLEQQQGQIEQLKRERDSVTKDRDFILEGKKNARTNVLNHVILRMTGEKNNKPQSGDYYYVTQEDWDSLTKALAQRDLVNKVEGAETVCRQIIATNFETPVLKAIQIDIKKRIKQLKKRG